MKYSDEEIAGMNLELLTSLREQIIDPLTPKSEFSTQLLEKIDLALMSLLDREFIKNK